jgi:hypothetical protein
MDYEIFVGKLGAKLSFPDLSAQAALDRVRILQARNTAFTVVDHKGEVVDPAGLVGLAGE